MEESGVGNDSSSLGNWDAVGSAGMDQEERGPARSRTHERSPAGRPTPGGGASTRVDWNLRAENSGPQLSTS
ncbi:hypothetical protein KM043_005828 [Ampulex compressa]|nr:hypothetical protein KM043_005828 [Ampulex compressa]